MTRKTTNATNATVAAYTFGVDTLTILGRTYAARYSCTPKGHVYVFSSVPFAEGDGTTEAAVPVRLHFAPDMPMYEAAYKAAKAAKVAPVNPHDPTVAAPAKQEKPAAKQPKAAAKAAEAPAKQEKPAEKAQPKAEKPAAKPATTQPKAEKPAKPAVKAQPKAEKPAAKPAAPAAKQQPTEEPLTAANYVGRKIVGNGWTITFDADAQRTRVTFAKQATLAQKQAVDDAGFYWSAAMGSFNKKLTVKAMRAAMALADTLKALK